MKKSEILNKISKFVVYQNVDSCSDPQLFKITADSREVCPGAIFFCEKGINVDGHDFIDMALNNGAELIIGENEAAVKNYIQVKSVKEVLSHLLPEFYDYPDKKMKMVGITGTNGKTSISLLKESLLKDRFSCGVTGTLGYKYAGREIKAANTTPVNWKWYELISDMYKNGVEVLFSEVSSHALSEERIVSTAFDVAIFTNLSRDHLDFHNDIEDYYQAKKKLFTDHLKKDAICIVNVDDGYGKRLAQEMETSVEIIKISEKDADAQLKFTVLDSSRKGSKVVLDNKGYEVNVPLVGKYNIYNMLSALAASEVLGESVYEKCCSKAVVIPGRLEKIGENVFVDYAHTPDALENVLITLKEIAERGVITVFGAGGDRDRGKRSEMGRIATQYSRVSIITDDNPRTENPDRITEDILNGCNTRRSVVEVIRDRSAAIKRALELAQPGDLILVAGKGAEDYQITNEGKIYFSDKEEIERYIRELHDVHDKLD